MRQEWTQPTCGCCPWPAGLSPIEHCLGQVLLWTQEVSAFLSFLAGELIELKEREGFFVCGGIEELNLYQKMDSGNMELICACLVASVPGAAPQPPHHLPSRTQADVPMCTVPCKSQTGL